MTGGSRSRAGKAVGRLAGGSRFVDVRGVGARSAPAGGLPEPRGVTSTASGGFARRLNRAEPDSGALGDERASAAKAMPSAPTARFRRVTHSTPTRRSGGAPDLDRAVPAPRMARRSCREPGRRAAAAADRARPGYRPGRSNNLSPARTRRAGAPIVVRDRAAGVCRRPPQRMTTSSTRRFASRPCGVSFGAIGRVSP